MPLDQDMQDEHTPADPFRSSIEQAFAYLFGPVIAARVLVQPNLIRIALEGLVYAFVAGALGWLVLGVPGLVCFGATLGLMGEAVAQVHFSQAYGIYERWTALRRQLYAFAGVFMVARLLVGAAVGLQPDESFRILNETGGLIGVAGRAAGPPREVMFELLFAMIFGHLTYLAVFARQRRAQVILICVSGCAAVLAMAWS